MTTFDPHANRSTPEGTREDTREILDSSHDPLLGDAHAAIEDLIADVCKKYGGAKSLAGGRVPLSYPQIRKMTGDGSIPNFEQILLFVRLAGPKHAFRPALIETLIHMFDPPTERVVEMVQERAGDEAAAAVASVFRELNGRWVR